MYKGKHAPKRKKYTLGNFRPLALVMSVVIIIGCAVSGSVAWLTSSATPVSNAFTVGNINIELNGSELSATDKYVPGETIAFKPTVTVKAGSEKCYLFVRIKEENNKIDGLEGKVIQWALADNDWENVGGNFVNYYWKLIDTADIDMELKILNDTKYPVHVNKNLTKAMIDNMSVPNITISAIAIQAESIPDANNNGYVDEWDATMLIPWQFNQ